MQPALIKISAEEGYRPHFSRDFVQRYGYDSLFVLGVADCLTKRHMRIVTRAEQVVPEIEALRLGPAGACEAVENLMSALIDRSVEKPVVRLLQVATGRASPVALESDVDAALGFGTFAHWLAALGHRDYAAAATALGA
jgi:hypothetical protein